MCEIFCVSSVDKVKVNDLLKEFFSHSVDHPNGWGLATFYGNSVSLEKEPLPAYKSTYLKERLNHTIETRQMIAHIRLATRGHIDYKNCHPFVMRDNFDRVWTLVHNGTIFQSLVLEKYIHHQDGQTDSERILCYIIDKINQLQLHLKRPLHDYERFQLLDEIICQLSPHNKLNLVIYDSEQFYIHTNYANSLYMKQDEKSAIISTVPLDKTQWDPVPFTTLLAYKEGKQIFSGTNHGCEYKDNPQDMNLLFVDYSGL